MTNQAFIQNIRNRIAKDDLAAAIALLKDLLVHTPLLNEVLQQSGRFEYILKQIRLGTLSHQEAALTRDQIRLALLDLVAEVEQQDEKPAVGAEIEKAATIVHAKNVVAGAGIQAQTVSIGDKTEVHHHYGQEKTSRSIVLKIGAALAAIVGLLAGIAEFTGISLKDIWPGSGRPAIETQPHQAPVTTEAPVVEQPPAPEPQKRPATKQTTTAPRNHFESHDSSKQINIPDNQGTIHINQ